MFCHGENICMWVSNIKRHRRQTVREHAQLNNVLLCNGCS